MNAPILVYLELKDELGEVGLKAELSLRKFVSQDAVKLPVIAPQLLTFYHWKVFTVR